MTGLLGAVVPAPVSIALKVAPYAAIVLLAGLAWHFDARAVANADTVKTQAAQFKQAQTDAAMAAQKALQTETAQYAAKAKDADNAYQTQLVAAQSATSAYIASHRVVWMRPATTGGSTTNADPAAQGSSTQGSNRPGAIADMVAVSPADLNVCTVNTKRLQVVHDWATTLNIEN